MMLSLCEDLHQKNHRLIRLTRMTFSVGKSTLVGGPICFDWPAGVNTKRKVQGVERQQAMMHDLAALGFLRVRLV